MDIFEEAKLALRKHLKENKKQVRKDLKKMRKMSSGEIAFMGLILRNRMAVRIYVQHKLNKHC